MSWKKNQWGSHENFAVGQIWLRAVVFITNNFTNYLFLNLKKKKDVNF